jgi:hypothetical protein
LNKNVSIEDGGNFEEEALPNGTGKKGKRAAKRREGGNLRRKQLKKRKKHFQRMRQMKMHKTVDLRFLVGVTSSMQPYIDEVRKSIHTIVSSLKTPESTDGIKVSDLRLAFVGYRGVDDEKSLKFRLSLRTFQCSLRSAAASKRVA